MIKIGDILEGKISMNATGSAYLVSNDLPKDIYIHKNNTNKSLHLDNVKIRVIEGNGRALEGEVIEIVERFKTEFVGVIQVSPRYAFFVPDSSKMPIDLFIPLSKLMGATDGQKVIARITEWKDDAKNPNGEILRVIGDAGEHETEIHSILEEYGLPYDFDEDVIAESEAIPTEIPQAEIDKRRDMRSVLTFTIDPETAKDFDDALSYETTDDGYVLLGVHIADVSHYLRPETSLDKEAYTRGTSVYLVDRCVPMLPERLSNGLCSLRPNEDKLCFSAIFKLDENGHVIEEWFGRTVITSTHRFSYEEAQEVIEGNSENLKIKLKEFWGEHKNLYHVLSEELTDAILTLDKMAKSMRKQRMNQGSISFDKQEVKFKLDEHNKPTDIIFKTSKDAHKLIEEYMLLANRRVAAFINSKKYPMVNRGHDKPNEEKLENLKEFIKQFGYVINTDTPADTTRTLNKLLIDVRGTSEATMIESLVVRTMQKANYTTENVGHYGLGFKDYTHFTSPIRRYPDVMVHRLLGRYLSEIKSIPKVEKLEAKCQYLSQREKLAQKAERDSIKYMQCIYMAERVGKVYTGIITSVAEYGVFVEIEENKCEGLVRLSEIGGDTFIADINNYCLKGFNTGEVIRLGDKVHIVVKSVDIEKKNINLTLIRL